MELSTLSLTIKKDNTTSKTFSFGDPVSVSRPIALYPQLKSSNAFDLPSFQSKPIKISELFIGDVTKGGSCNVDLLTLCPHNLTHIETSAHILEQNNLSFTLDKISPKSLQGICYLIDLTSISQNSKFIPMDLLKNKIKKVNLPITMLALKTISSNLSPYYNFTEKQFLALNPQSTQLIHDLQFHIYSTTTTIGCLLLDLPSADPENDDGKLLAHRNYFGIPHDGYQGKDNEKRLLVELAYFNNLNEGYYYCITSPPRIQTNSFLVNILFYPLTEIFHK